MDYLKYLKSENLGLLIQQIGYVGMALIIFTETGLLVGFFLPGDSLLFAAGLASNPGNPLHLPVPPDLLILNLCLIPAAIVGDSVGYFIGYRAGVTLYKREKTLWFRKDHLLKTHEFYETWGGITIVIARFVPLLRTFAPVVAGIAQMSYRKFVVYNIVGGAGWVIGLTVLGYFLGEIHWIREHLEGAIMAIVFVSIIPVIVSVLKARFGKSGVKPAQPVEGGPQA
jgi:membrane-associated protein